MSPPEVGEYVTLWVMGKKVRCAVYCYLRRSSVYWVDMTLWLQSSVAGRVYERHVTAPYRWDRGVLKQVKEG